MKKAKPVASKRSRASIAVAPPAVDDFKLIGGIGPAIESRLHKAGILTFAQLAALSPADLASLAVGFSAKRIAEQDWIGQARQLAKKLATRRQHYATYTVELLLDEDNEVRRTRAVYVQGGNEDIWAGWDEAHLIDFLVQHAGVHRQPAEPAAAPTAQPQAAGTTSINRIKDKAPRAAEASAAEPQVALPTEVREGELEADLRLEVSDMQLVKLPTEGWVGGPMLTKRIRAHISFQLSGTAANPITAHQSSCFIHILACQLATGQTTVLAANQLRLQPNLLTYTTTVEFPLPKVGRYQVVGMVLLPDGNTVGVQLGPILTVIP